MMHNLIESNKELLSPTKLKKRSKRLKCEYFLITIQKYHNNNLGLYKYKISITIKITNWNKIENLSLRKKKN